MEFGIEVVLEVWDASEGGSIGWATEKGRSRSLVERRVVLLARLRSAVQCSAGVWRNGCVCASFWMIIVHYRDIHRFLGSHPSSQCSSLLLPGLGGIMLNGLIYNKPLETYDKLGMNPHFI